MKSTLTPIEKQHLFDHGYVIIRDAVSREMIDKARALVTEALPEDEHQLLVPGKLATHEDMVGLLNSSSLAAILNSEMGPFPPVISCQVAVLPPFESLGGQPGTHVDGGWSGRIPDKAEEINLETGRPFNDAAYFGTNDEVRGYNDGLLWMDKEQRRLSYGSYTALVGVALNDQLIPGHGQFAVLSDTHEEVEACFRAQRDAGGTVGPEGPDWPRIKIGKSGRPYCNGLPDRIREIAEQRRADGEATDEWPWPELTSVLLGAGDAVIALHSCPHTPTPNLGPNPRMNIYFRVRRLREGDPNEGARRRAHGVNDHPERGYFGQFLDYPEGYDHIAESIDRLCDHWQEWDGMQSLIKARQESVS